MEWSPTGKAVPTRQKVSAFVETVRASRLYGTQAWFSARADERRLN